MPGGSHTTLRHQLLVVWQESPAFLSLACMPAARRLQRLLLADQVKVHAALLLLLLWWWL